MHQSCETCKFCFYWELLRSVPLRWNKTLEYSNHRWQPGVCKCQGSYLSKNIRNIGFKNSVSTTSWSISKSPACVLNFTGYQQQLQKSESQQTDWEQERNKRPTQWRNQVTNAFTVTISYFWKSHAGGTLNSICLITSKICYCRKVKTQEFKNLTKSKPVYNSFLRTQAYYDSEINQNHYTNSNKKEKVL